MDGQCGKMPYHDSFSSSITILSQFFFMLLFMVILSYIAVQPPTRYQRLKEKGVTDHLDQNTISSSFQRCS